MVRIKDVARHAGVSTATVSRVINGIRVDEALTENVQRSILELGYLPDRQARSLRRQRSELVALVLPDIENPYWTAMARGVENIAQEAGYSVVLCNTDEMPNKESTYLSIARSEKMAGVIIAAASSTPTLGRLLSDGRAVIAVDRVVDAAVDTVTSDNVGLGRHATRDLIDRGYRSIACVTGPSSASTAVQRADGWRSVMRSKKLSTKGMLRHVNFRVDGGREAALDLLSAPSPPDAIVATNNLVGVGVLQVLNEQHTSDVGCAVIGELPFTTARTPNATITPLHPRQMGETAARMLLERIDGFDESPRVIVQPLNEATGHFW